jgi:hypothetical protein
LERKTKKSLKYLAIPTVLISVAALATDTAPSGFQFDNQAPDKGGASGDIVGGLHTTSETIPGGRAEWRCNPDNTACSTKSGTISFSKEFKVNGGANISLVQFLNIEGTGTSGGSKPISQITVDDQQPEPLNKRSYRVSIEQDNKDCNFRITKGQWYTITASISKGTQGTFSIGGQSCSRPSSSVSAGSTDSRTSGRVYYLKWGAYNAAEGVGESSVSWR